MLDNEKNDIETLTDNKITKEVRKKKPIIIIITIGIALLLLLFMGMIYKIISSLV
ncbi:MAG: hypothetical protein NTV45_04075 [Firmicutes bacterium]|nr:hypothetical protein [Bacillota bacterium]